MKAGGVIWDYTVTLTAADNLYQCFGVVLDANWRNV
jgi:hypothetical protein